MSVVWPLIGRVLKRGGIRRDRRGGTLLEFAIVAAPFMFLLFGTLELGLIFVANVSLSNAALQVARQVKVGTLVLPGATVSTSSGSQLSLSDFKTTICNNVPLLDNATCLQLIQVDVRTQASFGSSTATNPVSNKNFSTSGFCYYSGGPGSIVNMRVFLLWPLATPLLSGLATVTSLTTGSGSTSGIYYLLMSSEVFKNEPNATATNTGNGC